MARGDLSIVSQADPAFAQTRNVASGAAATIKAGEPTKETSTWDGNVAIMADGDGTTSQRFSGIAKTDSTDTVAAAGEVNVWIPLAGLLYSGKAKSSTAADTAAEVQALIGKRVVFDLTSSTWTIDTAAADSATNGVVLMGGDFNTNRVWFVVSPTCSNFE